jgi:hypothetical protein
MTELERNKRLATGWLGLVSSGEVETLCRLSALDWRMYGGPPGLPSGHAGLRALFGHIGPVEQKWTVDDVIAEGDRVVVRATNCLPAGGVLRVPARGKRQGFTATFTFRIADQLVAEVWRNADDLGRLLQLGARIVPGEE